MKRKHSWDIRYNASSNIWLVMRSWKNRKHFLKTCKAIPKSDMPLNANIIKRHKIYKVNTNDDGKLKMKARITPHGNEDDLKICSEMSNMLTNRTQNCSNSGITFRWIMYKANVVSAFLQTEKANMDVYVQPCFESSIRTSHLWLL